MMKAKKGFTLIELMLAMLYVALLLVTIATLIMHVMDSYKKGMAIKEVNINARSIIDDITQTVANAPPIGSLINDAGEATYKPPEEGNTVGQTSYYREMRTSVNNRIDGGILCTGNYSYIWKHADRQKSDWRFGQGVDSTADGTGDQGDLNIEGFLDGGRDFRLVKVRDPSRKACEVVNDGGITRVTPNIRQATFTTSEGEAFNETFVELLTNNEMDLALYDFKAFTPATSQSNGQTFYGFSFILGTIRGVNRDGALIPNESCYAPQDRADTNSDDAIDFVNDQHIGFDFSYCSVNKFNFSARSSGAVLKGSS
ncbi:MAG: type II secretion system GspH family protein [Candidatus Nomurabacteria bacterium]|jgi:type II secretory pathway pseudopilin PulG|nr:type II secretion system GspH family protein [Candidatus Nomurabacteria bacterium]